MAAIGIDLGTTNSCVAVFKEGKIEIVTNTTGQRTTPSYVAFTAEEPVIGVVARKQIIRNSMNTVFNVKRLIGRDFTDPCVTLQCKYLPFELVSKDDKPMISVMSKNKQTLFSPEEVSAMILSEMKKIAEARLEEKVTDAVITVPAHFNDYQRRATMKAGTLAGLQVLQIINEPTAAAIAYGLSRSIIKVINVLIFDLGGGTFDVTLVRMKAGEINVIATGGDTQLGGEDFNSRIADHFIKEFERKHGKDITKNKRAVCRLLSQCEEAKCTLSYCPIATLEIHWIIGEVDFYETLTRDRFDELNNDLFESTLEHVKKILEDAHMERNDVDRIVVVGGSTRIPKVQKLLKDFFNGKDLSTSINPDEAIAFGAAAQAAMVKGYKLDGLNEILLQDVVPLSLGVWSRGDLMGIIIKSNTPIPIKQTTEGTTYKDNQTKVILFIYEGERKRASANTSLGKIEISGIPSARRGVVRIDITFEIDRNGILKVSAVCRGVGEPKELTVHNYRGRLTTASIDDKVYDAERFKVEDDEHEKRSTAMVELENYAYKMRSEVEEMFKKGEISASDADSVTKKCNEVVAWSIANESAPKEEFECHRKELESICAPIIRNND